MCSNWRKDRKQLSATEEWVTVASSQTNIVLMKKNTSAHQPKASVAHEPVISFVSYFQIIGPLEEVEVFNQDDFLLLESIILKTSGERIKSKIQQIGTEEDRCVYAVCGGYVWSGAFRVSLCKNWWIFSQGQWPRDEGGRSAVLSAQSRRQSRIWLRWWPLQVRLDIDNNDIFISHTYDTVNHQSDEQNEWSNQNKNGQFT